MRTISQIVDDGVVNPEIEAIFGKIKNVLEAPFTPNLFRV